MASLALPAPDANPPYHWTPPLQRAFLEALAETGSIGQAVAAVRMSRRAAYNLRHRRDGAAFRLGWDAALLIARATLADALMERAIAGQDDIVERDGNVITRHRCDNRLGMSLLSRLDRMAETDLTAGSEGALARRVSQDFEAFLDLVEAGGAADAVVLFVANGQCELVAAAPPPPLDDPAARAARMKVWRSEYSGQWRTSFPPPPGFRGYQSGPFGARDYARALTREEREAAELTAAAELEPLFEAGDAARDAWFGFAPAEITDDDDEDDDDEDGYDGDHREEDGDDYEDEDQDKDDEGGEGELEKMEEEEELTPKSDLAELVEAPPFLLAGEQNKESPSTSSGKPECSPTPDPILRPVPTPPRPTPYAGGRPPEWLRAANRSYG